MAQSLNTLVVKVMGDIKDVQAKLKKLDNRVKASNKKIDKFSQSIKKGFTNFLKYTAIITTTIMAVRKLTQFMTSSIRAYNEQVLSLTKLETTLKSTGRFTLETRDKLVEFATEMQRTTGISDSLVISAEAIMTTFTQISTETFPEAITLAADMSKLFGQDLQQSVIQLGTALNDPIRGIGRLRRIGISFSEEQKKQIELFTEQNDLMSAQRIILDELQLELGGTAKAMGQTMAGQMSILKETFVDLQEEIGFLTESGLPALIVMATDVVLVFTKIISKFNKAKRELAAFREELGERTVESLKEAVEWQDNHVQSLVDVIAPIQRNIEALEKLEKRNREQRKTLRDLKDQYDELIPTYDGALKVLNEYRDALEEAEIEQELLKDEIIETEPPLVEQEKVILDVSDAWSRYADNMRNATNGNIKLVESVKKIGPILDEQQEPIRQFSRSILDGNADIIDSIDDLIEAEETMGERHEQIFKDQMVEAWVELFNVSRSMSENIKEALKALFVTFLRGLGKEFAALAIAQVFLLQFVAAARSALAASAMFVAASAIQSLAEGGVATRATLAQIGEAGPEAVVPLSKDALKPFAQAIVGEIGKLQAPGAPNIAMGNNVFNIKIGSEPIIRVVQKGFDNKQLRANVKTIR